jgi:hypothetical protein
MVSHPHRSKRRAAKAAAPVDQVASAAPTLERSYGIRVEIDRGDGWRMRQEGYLVIGYDDVLARFEGYCLQYPHRLFIDGALVREWKP